MRNPLKGRVLLNPSGKTIVDGNVQRSGKMAHNCYEWDEMLIDETDPEYDACLCGRITKTNRRSKK